MNPNRYFHNGEWVFLENDSLYLGAYRSTQGGYYLEMNNYKGNYYNPGHYIFEIPFFERVVYLPVYILNGGAHKDLGAVYVANFPCVFNSRRSLVKTMRIDSGMGYLTLDFETIPEIGFLNNRAVFLGVDYQLGVAQEGDRGGNEIKFKIMDSNIIQPISKLRYGGI